MQLVVLGSEDAQRHLLGAFFVVRVHGQQGPNVRVVRRDVHRTAAPRDEKKRSGLEKIGRRNGRANDEERKDRKQEKKR